MKKLLYCIIYTRDNVAPSMFSEWRNCIVDDDVSGPTTPRRPSIQCMYRTHLPLPPLHKSLYKTIRVHAYVDNITAHIFLQIKESSHPRIQYAFYRIQNSSNADWLILTVLIDARETILFRNAPSYVSRQDNNCRIYMRASVLSAL
jgi:hypothetical protein